MPPLPPAFLERMERLLGAEYPAWLACYEQSATTGLRVNTLKIAPEALQALAPFPLEPVPWSASGFRLAAGSPSPGKHPYHAAGLYYLQDPSAMAAAEILAPQPGERVLDLSAAPGGKTTHLAALMQNRGLLVANEIHPRRAWDLAENLERCGVRMACLLNETPARLAGRFGAFFDRVLVDAPCSGEGLFRKNPEARRAWSVAHVLACAARQIAILEQAARMVRPGGWLLYATCTFAPEENEGVIGRFLEAFPNFALQRVEPRPGFSPGRPGWAPGFSHHPLEMTIRLWPQHGAGEGHFFALLRRQDEEGASPPKEEQGGGRPPEARQLPSRVWQLYEAFCRETLLRLPEEEGLRLLGSYLYRLPPGLPPLDGLKTLHPGWWLGTLKKNRFEPSHALALGLPGDQARRLLRLESGDPRVLAYLRGEAIRLQAQEASASGWGLVAVDGYALGWGKFSPGLVKNGYPRGLRSAWSGS